MGLGCNFNNWNKIKIYYNLLQPSNYKVSSLNLKPAVNKTVAILYL